MGTPATGIERIAIDQTLGSARQLLGEPAVAQCWTRGQEAPLHAVLAEALVGVARTLGRSVTMVSGVLAALVVIGMSVLAILAAPFGATPAGLRLLFLLPVAWLFCVSTRRANA